MKKWLMADPPVSKNDRRNFITPPSGLSFQIVPNSLKTASGRCGSSTTFSFGKPSTASRHTRAKLSALSYRRQCANECPFL
nr:MAG TPA: hypothetical protein [Caudoviricetes sp.]